MDLNYLSLVRAIASWPERGFLVGIDAAELSLEVERFGNEQGLASHLYGPGKFDQLLEVRGTAPWLELMPIWIQHFLRDVRLALYLEKTLWESKRIF